ncbi:exosortase F system-associated protein [Flavobacterium sp. NKUCC04_CG]|uniref:exosortase F system-associated membrane protein n=1 Tax=Flavobacterium sp. NKUCC04_CG TaxID=2842121 RepID=UPI00351DA842
MRILGIIICVVLLALIRYFETTLFYDPFLLFFKGHFQNAPLPHIEYTRLIGNYIFRYALNSSLSLLIIYLCLQDRLAIRFSAWMYLFLLGLLLALFCSVLWLFKEPDKMFIFYIRRLLLQPVFLLLFLAGFLYQNHVKTMKP